MELNLLAPKWVYGFGRLVDDAFRANGATVHWWDYRKERYPLDTLNPDAPTIVLRGDVPDAIAHALFNIKGKKILWYTEDPLRDKGGEVLGNLPYYDECWIHWTNVNLVENAKRLFPRITFRCMPILYADQNIWKPESDWANPEVPKRCDVLLYGSVTPRREAILNAIKKILYQQGRELVFREVFDVDHEGLAREVNGAKVVLNLHAWSPVNLEVRIAEVLSCGAFLVTEELPPVEGWDKSIIGADGIVGHVQADNDLEIAEKLAQLLWIMTQENYWARRSIYGPQIYEFAQKNFSHLNIFRDIEQWLV